jgi:hypothetical protein
MCLVAGRYQRDDPVFSPASDIEDSVLVGSPYSLGPHNSQIPQDDEAVSVASRQAVVATDETCRMDL